LEDAVPVDLSIKNVPDDIVEDLRLRAKSNHRSLQGELMAIIEATVRPTSAASMKALLEELAALNLDQSVNSVDIIRADRDRD
jgi:plasmid stability protein